MKVEVGKRHILLIAAVLLAWFGVFAVYAYGSNPAVPSSFGHTINEVEGISCGVGQAVTRNATGWSCINVGSGGGSGVPASTILSTNWFSFNVTNSYVDNLGMTFKIVNDSASIFRIDAHYDGSAALNSVGGATCEHSILIKMDDSSLPITYLKSVRMLMDFDTANGNSGAGGWTSSPKAGKGWAFTTCTVHDYNADYLNPNTFRYLRLLCSGDTARYPGFTCALDAAAGNPAKYPVVKLVFEYSNVAV